jgi:hypothetical protein
LAEHDEGRLDYPSGRGPSSLIVRYAVRDNAVLLRLPTFNHLLQYVPGERVTLAVDERAPAGEFEAVSVSGRARLIDPRDKAMSEGWPNGLPSEVISVLIERIDGFLDELMGH